MATLGLKEMGKFFWEGGEKVLSNWLSQFSYLGSQSYVCLENAKKSLVHTVFPRIVSALE